MMMLLLFYTLLILSGIAAFVWSLMWLLKLFDDTQRLRHPWYSDKKVRLTFVQFANLYGASPDAWKISKEHVTYWGKDRYNVVFSLYSAWQYRRWWCYRDRCAARAKKLQDQADFITDMRTTLAKADAQHKADMRRKLNSLWD